MKVCLKFKTYIGTWEIIEMLDVQEIKKIGYDHLDFSREGGKGLIKSLSKEIAWLKIEK